LDQLQRVIETSLKAHALADWTSPKVRKIIAGVIVKRFKKYLEKEWPSPGTFINDFGDDDWAKPEDD
jgi:hypothetical protein